MNFFPIQQLLVELVKKNITYFGTVIGVEINKIKPNNDRQCYICYKESSNESNLKTHLWFVHNIGKGQIFKCLECDYTTKRKSDLTKHIYYKHTPENINWIYCIKCKVKFKTISDLNQHLWQIHNMGKGKLYKCINCEYSTKRKGDLTKHIRYNHIQENEQWFKCSKCDHKSKSMSDFKKHLWQVHTDGNGKWYSCEYCSAKFKVQSNLNYHLSSIHDIGDKKCEYCYSNVYKLNIYVDPILEKEINICSNCYRTKTKHHTSKEKEMVDYLRIYFGQYFVLENQIIKGNNCNTKRRPDLLISSTKELHIFVECDEHQHRGYLRDCEDGRLDELFDEMKEGRIIVIRWNPDNYKTIGPKKNRSERLLALKELIDKLIIKQDWTENEHIKLYYLFYDKDNDFITQRFNKEIL